MYIPGHLAGGLVVGARANAGPATSCASTRVRHAACN